MHLKLKLAIEEALTKVLEDYADDNLWQDYIHDTLTAQMTNAAEAVFDSSMDGQKFKADIDNDAVPFDSKRKPK